MRKPSSAMILSVLLALSWLGFFVSNPRAAEDTKTIGWKYDRVTSDSDLTTRGKEGWEAYAVTRVGGPLTYYLKKRVE